MTAAANAGRASGANTGVHGIYLKTDNVVYSVDSIYVEYYDLVDQAWVTAETIGSIPSGS